MSTSKNRKKNTATAEPRPAKKTRKNRAVLGMNNTGTDQPPVPEPAAPVETPTEAETLVSDAAPVQLAGPAAVPVEPVAAATREAKPAQKARKGRTLAETAAPEAALAERAATGAAPTEPPTAATEPVASPETPKAPRIETDAPGSKFSAIDAAAKVLGEAGRPMTCQEMIDAMAAKGYWQSPGGKTPGATLYSSILREQKVRGDQTRFAKAERGKFTLAR